ncbi:LysR substrate-binding domain-containing protein [Aliiglaciecola sp.]|nr:LysR substrate-binding domain-containing protein [Aliiglaciecola sp.]
MQFKTGIWRKHHEKRVWQCGEVDVELNPIIQVNDYVHLRHLAVKGDIITELPPFFCHDHIKRNELISLLPDFGLPEHEVSLIYPTRKQISRLSRVYIDYCIEHGKEYL